MVKGNIKVTAENIFPIIKKFLYSDHEVFLREIISNSVDATIKLKRLAEMGKISNDVSNLIIEIKIDNINNTLHILDKGIGMTSEEVEKYLSKIAFSGAEEFIRKYKTNNNIIGHFGLGFYSVFLVSNKVDVFTKSYKKNAKAICWTCSGEPYFIIKDIEKKNWGTEVVLHINEENKEFLKKERIKELLDKYCKFMPVPIKFGERKEKKNGIIKVVDNIINNPNPIWNKNPLSLKDEDYKNFYFELYPMKSSYPLFWIHLNIDHPFNLKGILYFPKIKNKDEYIKKHKIKLYKNQVFVTENIENIVPEFLTFIRGVIDSQDIPLNVSRSSFQFDSSVKKISNYITKKVGDRLEFLFKKNREVFKKKWEKIKIIIEYGMLSIDSFFEKAQKFALYKTVKGEFFTFEEFTKKIEKNQKDINGRLIYLYTSNKEDQHSYVIDALNKGYEVLIFQSPLDYYLIQKLENLNRNIYFFSVDSNYIDNFIKKKEEKLSLFDKKKEEKLKLYFSQNIKDKRFHFKVKYFENTLLPIIITIPEYVKRFKEKKIDIGIDKEYLSEEYYIFINSNHELINKILNEKDENKKKYIIKNAIFLAQLSHGLIKGEELTNFILYNFKKLVLI
jgi:molecular chaperone HtpG